MGIGWESDGNRMGICCEPAHSQKLPCNDTMAAQQVPLQQFKYNIGQKITKQRSGGKEQKCYRPYELKVLGRIALARLQILH